MWAKATLVIHSKIKQPARPAGHVIITRMLMDDVHNKTNFTVDREE